MVYYAADQYSCPVLAYMKRYLSIFLGGLLLVGLTAHATEVASPGYAQSIAQLKRVASQSSKIQVVQFGKSGQGRALYAAIVSNGGSAAPAEAKASGKAVVLVTAGVRAGSLADKDGALAWLSQIANNSNTKLLDHVVIVVVPVLNADGIARLATTGGEISIRQALGAPFQGSANLVRLSQDYLYADSAAMQAWLKLFSEWQPDALVTLSANINGIPSRYDLTYAMVPAEGLTQPVANWQSRALTGNLPKALTGAGLSVAPCFEPRQPADPQAGLIGCFPKKSNLLEFGALENRPVVELRVSRTLPYAKQMQVADTGLGAILGLLSDHAHSLTKAIADGESNPMAGESSDGFALSFKPAKTGDKHRFEGYEYTTMLSPISGSVWLHYMLNQPKTYYLKWDRRARVAVRQKTPSGYLIPSAWPHLIALLKRHDVRYQKLGTGKKIKVVVSQITAVTWRKRPEDGLIAPRSYGVISHIETRSFPAGTIEISSDQPQAKLVAALFDPHSPLSVVATGRVNRVFDHAVHLPNARLEEKAQRLLRKNPDMARQFAKRLATEPAFAASPGRRLAYFVAHGALADPVLDVYPVYEIAQAAGKKQ